MKKWNIMILANLVLLICLAGCGAPAATEETPPVPETTTPATTEAEPPASETAETASAEATAFAGEPGITVNAELGTDIIDMPELSVSITNNTDKEIAAVQFYAIPYDVYGEELSDLFTQNKLYTDTAIAPGKSDGGAWQFLDDNIKTIRLYVYSVYFADGTEWGDRNATKSIILEHGQEITVSSSL